MYTMSVYFILWAYVHDIPNTYINNYVIHHPSDDCSLAGDCHEASPPNFTFPYYCGLTYTILIIQ